MLTPRQREVLAAWADRNAPAINGTPSVIDRQLNSGNTHHQSMMLHGLRLVLFRLERKGLTTWTKQNGREALAKTFR